MRTFVKFNQRGDIVATLRIESLPEGLQQPFVLLQQGESVAEVASEEGAGGFSLADLHQGYQVDVAEGTLVPRSAAPKSAPARTRRKAAAAKPAARSPAKARRATKAPTKHKAKVKAKAPTRTKKAPARKKKG
jgi:hypothetical protein